MINLHKLFSSCSWKKY